MQATPPTRVHDAAELARLDPERIAQLMRAYAHTIDALRHQLDWFKRQVFGSKSERFVPEPDAHQMHLGELLPLQAQQPEAGSQVPAHTRRKHRRDFVEDDDRGAPFFDASKVPVQTIEVPNPEIKGLSPDQYEVIGEKVTHRLAQRPGSYVVLKYVRPVIKRLDSQRLHCAYAPAGVIEGSRADVSFIAGVLLDKFAWHLPLYRQHQRLIAAGFKLSRQWLTQLVQQGAQLLKPIYEAQLASVCSSRVKAMDETSVKAGRTTPGKMNTGYFWPIYGEHDEVCFPFFDSREHDNVQQALGLKQPNDAVLLSDGYEA
jgi:transposase